MSHPERPAAELDEALTHVSYEILMMVEGVVRASAITPDPSDFVMRNAWVESYIMHARSLIDFSSRSEPHRKPDDLCPRDFGVDWTIDDLDRQWLETNLMQQAHKRIAHLTWERLKPLEEGWSKEVAQRITDVCRSWRRTVEETRQDLDWSTFYTPPAR